MLLLFGVVSSLETDVALTCVHVGSSSLLPSLSLARRGFFQKLAASVVCLQPELCTARAPLLEWCVCVSLADEKNSVRGTYAA